MDLRGKGPASLVVLLGAILVTVIAAQPGTESPAATDSPSTPSASSPALARVASPAATSHGPSLNPTAMPSAGLAGSSAGPTATQALTVTATPALPTTAPTAGPTNAPVTPPPATTSPTVPPTAPPTPPPTAGPIPALSACQIFPATNVWNRRVDGLPVASNSATMLEAIGLGASLHPDFSDAGGYGIPFNVVGTSTPRSTVSFDYDDESDHVGYPIPASPKIEGGSDRHVLMIDTNDCSLYELFAAVKVGGQWQAGSGAVWDLGSNALRPDGWTSADAAGLPIFPGLVRWSDVAAGEILHAIRFTAPQTCDGYIYPARHEAGSGACSSRPPMGLRVRLKASVDISGFGPQAQVVLRALQRYGMLLADNGSPWYITGSPDSHWDDDQLHDLGQIHGSDFEVVDTAGFVNG